ncbi:MAG: prephenate dehydrogenase, partial [Clostridia bacterium]|nr:prephenate dehydrogenase [Clostridia bacterium]
MKIGIVGLGLMGGSILKAIKARTSHECWAYNRTKSVLDAAALYLDGVLDTNTIKDVDIVFVCLMPKATIDFVFKNAENFKKGCIVTDICGVKKHIVENLEKPLQSIGVHFVGAHPMAGKEVGGFCNSSEDLFANASYILTPTARTDKKAVETLEKLAFEIGFKSVVKASPEEHDEIIAYTSQLAHIVSNAYVKSPKLSRHAGFSAGSFQDLTR